MVTLFNIAALLCWGGAAYTGSGHGLVAGAVFAIGAAIIDELRKSRAAPSAKAEQEGPARQKFDVPEFRRPPI